jgi:hypothetical protein
MTDGKIQAARKLLVSGTPPHEVAHSLVRRVGPHVISMGTGLLTDLRPPGRRVDHPVRTLIVTELRSGRLTKRTLAHRGYSGGGVPCE